MYTLQRTSLQNSAKLCIHVESSLYVFVSKVQYWLIKEGVSVENLQCAKVSRKSFQRQPGIKCLGRPSVSVTQQFYSCSASKDFGALMTSLSFQTSVSSSLNQAWESLPHRFVVKMYLGFPSGASGTGPACQCRRHKRCRFNPRVRKICWRRARKLTPVFLTGKSLGQRSLVGCEFMG